MGLSENLPFFPCYFFRYRFPVDVLAQLQCGPCGSWLRGPAPLRHQHILLAVCRLCHDLCPLTCLPEKWWQMETEHGEKLVIFITFSWAQKFNGTERSRSCRTLHDVMYQLTLHDFIFVTTDDKFFTSSLTGPCAKCYFGRWCCHRNRFQHVSQSVGSASDWLLRWRLEHRRIRLSDCKWTYKSENKQINSQILLKLAKTNRVGLFPVECLNK